MSELAYEGGSPSIPRERRKVAAPVLDDTDVEAALQVMRSGRIDPRGPGTGTDRFAEEYRAYVGARYAVPFNSGTASLHASIVAAGVQPGQEVIVPALTFIASGLAVLHAGAVPVFADIDRRTFNIDPPSVEAVVTPQTAAILAVHCHGLPADMGPLRQVADRHGLLLLEDASHAHSARYKGAVAGTLGDGAGQSLMADKNFGVGGEGGIAFTESEERRSRLLQVRDRSGFNYRLPPLVAAVGISQLSRLPAHDAIRQRNALKLGRALAELGGVLEPPFVPEDRTHSYNMFRMTVRPERLGLEDLPPGAVKRALQTLLNAEGLAVREWQNVPLSGQPIFAPTARPDARPQRLEDAPATLEVLERTLVLCREFRAPIGDDLLDLYMLAIEKVLARRDAVAALAREYARDHVPTWKSTPRLG